LPESNHIVVEIADAHPGSDVERESLAEIRSQRAKIAVLGMGHVGLPTALSLCELGWHVLGADSASSLLQQLRAGEVPFYELGIQQLLRRHLNKSFEPSDDLGAAIRAATIVFICVGTPQGENGQADLSQVESVARTIAHNLNGYKLIVEKSTVPAVTAHWVKRTILRCARNGEKNGDSLPACDFAHSNVQFW
jgi:UDPglucose 6-dehydrogenase